MKKNRLLTIDVGNTSCGFGIFNISRTKRPDHVIRLNTPAIKRPSRSLLTQLKKYKYQGALVSSVVPSINPRLKTWIKRELNVVPHFVTYRTPSKIKVHTPRPQEVGADRIVNARGAIEYAKGPLIVVDFGTATTFDCVNARNQYQGGVIAPGPLISAQALSARTAKLPFVDLERPAKILGQTTLECIQAGLFHGYRGMVLEIVRQLKKKLGRSTTVLTTGGQAQWILKNTPLKNRFIPHLTLYGLLMFWHDQNR